jgi:hypothetical protein
MGEGDDAYAVVAAVPLDNKGVILIFGRQTNEERKFECGIDAGNCDFGMVGGETLVVFEDVFVPWERVFMCGETDFTGLLVERFATLHRQNYGGCKRGVCIFSKHRAGSPQSQRVMYQRLGKLGEKVKMAKQIAKITEWNQSLICPNLSHAFPKRKEI